MFDNHIFQLFSQQVNGRRCLQENFLSFAKIEHPYVLDLRSYIDVRLPVFHLFGEGCSLHDIESPKNWFKERLELHFYQECAPC